MTKQLNEVKLDDHAVIKFIPIDDTIGSKNLGRAEFQFCQVYNRRNGKLEKVYIYRLQQHNVKEFYSIDTSSEDFNIGSYRHKGIDAPYVWQMGYCKEHGGFAIKVFVPNGSNCFVVFNFGSFNIMFDKIMPRVKA